MQNPTPSTSSDKTHNIELSLKALNICPTENYQNHHHSCIMNTNLISQPSSSACFCHIGDYIGVESCLDLKNYEDVHMMKGGGESSTPTNVQSYRCRRNRRCAMKKREFPPPISLLARTENLPPHMPFVLKRYYTIDGRLILTEERVRHHEYFRAHRSNGHLTLQLVPLDDDAFFPPSGHENENDNGQHCNAEEEEEEELSLCGDGYENDERHCDGEEEEEKEEEEAEAESNAVTEDSCEESDYVNDIDDNINGEEQIADTDIGGLIVDMYESSQIPEPSIEDETTFGSGKCLNYNSVIISSSCFLGLPVPAIKPVHT